MKTTIIIITVTMILVHLNSVILLEKSNLSHNNNNNSTIVWNTIRSTRDVLFDSKKRSKSKKHRLTTFSDKNHKKEETSYPIVHNVGGDRGYCK